MENGVSDNATDKWQLHPPADPRPISHNFFNPISLQVHVAATVLCWFTAIVQALNFNAICTKVEPVFAWSMKAEYGKRGHGRLYLPHL